MAGDFHIAAASPAVDAGNPAYLPVAGEADLDGQPRLGGVVVDAGADELGMGLIFGDGFESGDTSAWSSP